MTTPLRPPAASPGMPNLADALADVPSRPGRNCHGCSNALHDQSIVFTDAAGNRWHQRCWDDRESEPAASPVAGMPAPEPAYVMPRCKYCGAAAGEPCAHGRGSFLPPAPAAPAEPRGEPRPTRVEERRLRFDVECGALGYISKHGRTGGNRHPDRCVCQGDETTPHKHYDHPPYRCARCGNCEAYQPALPDPAASPSPIGERATACVPFCGAKGAVHACGSEPEPASPVGEPDAEMTLEQAIAAVVAGEAVEGRALPGGEWFDVRRTSTFDIADLMPGGMEFRRRPQPQPAPQWSRVAEIYDEVAREVGYGSGEAKRAYELACSRVLREFVDAAYKEWDYELSIYDNIQRAGLRWLSGDAPGGGRK